MHPLFLNLHLRLVLHQSNRVGFFFSIYILGIRRHFLAERSRDERGTILGRIIPNRNLNSSFVPLSCCKTASSAIQHRWAKRLFSHTGQSAKLMQKLIIWRPYRRSRREFMSVLFMQNLSEINCKNWNSILHLRILVQTKSDNIQISIRYPYFALLSDMQMGRKIFSYVRISVLSKWAKNHFE